jgi:hypothetical protein
MDSGNKNNDQKYMKMIETDYVENLESLTDIVKECGISKIVLDYKKDLETWDQVFETEDDEVYKYKDIYIIFSKPHRIYSYMFNGFHIEVYYNKRKKRYETTIYDKYILCLKIREERGGINDGEYYRFRKYHLTNEMELPDKSGNHHYVWKRNTNEQETIQGCDRFINCGIYDIYNLKNGKTIITESLCGKTPHLINVLYHKNLGPRDTIMDTNRYIDIHNSLYDHMKEIGKLPETFEKL